jgi:hypothetical protein
MILASTFSALLLPPISFPESALWLSERDFSSKMETTPIGVSSDRLG